MPMKVCIYTAKTMSAEPLIMGPRANSKIHYMTVSVSSFSPSRSLDLFHKLMLLFLPLAHFVGFCFLVFFAEQQIQGKNYLGYGLKEIFFFGTTGEWAQVYMCSLVYFFVCTIFD